MYIKKGFDTLDQSFLTLALKKSGAGANFINWVETLIKDQKSCIINGGKVTLYFTLRIIVFKTLTLIKIVLQSLINIIANIIANQIVSKLISIQKDLIGKTQI